MTPPLSLNNHAQILSNEYNIRWGIMTTIIYNDFYKDLSIVKSTGILQHNRRFSRAKVYCNSKEIIFLEINSKTKLCLSSGLINQLKHNIFLV